MKMEKTKKFDQCLKNLLTVSGTGRDELARAVGVSVPVVNRWLNGASAPDVYQFRAIANYPLMIGLSPVERACSRGTGESAIAPASKR